MQKKIFKFISSPGYSPIITSTTAVVVSDAMNKVKSQISLPTQFRNQINNKHKFLNFGTFTHCKHRQQDAQRNYVHVKLSSNNETSIPKVWLRDNCQCPQCVEPYSKQKLHSSGDIDMHPEIESFKETDTQIFVAWKQEIKFNKTSTNGKQEQQVVHESVYEKAWLTRYFPRGISEFRSKMAFETWDSNLYAKTYPSPISFQDFNHEHGFFEALKRLTRSGLCLLKDVPTENVRQVESVATKFGNIMNTFYGVSWDVKSVPKAKNIAYTSVHLGLHMDLLYYGCPPGLQFLHCLKNSVKGGDSIFVDSFKAVEILKITDPKAYKILSTIPVTFHYRNDGHERHFRHLTFDYDELNGDLCVNYAPPFQGPLEVDGQVVQNVEDFYSAFKDFENIVNRNDLVYRTRLGPGNLAIFANRRVLHGRTEFDGTCGERHLRGTYVSWDDFKDKVRFHL